MHDLKGITFLTFVRLDNEERKANLKAMHSFYRNNCENYQHIFIEDDKEPKVTNTLNLGKDDVVVFSKSDTEWRKGEGFNKGIKLAKTNILNFIDTDIIIDPNQLLETAKILEKDDNAGFLYPYNGLFLCAEKPLKDKFCKTLNYEELLVVPDVVKEFEGSSGNNLSYDKNLVNTVHNDVLIGHTSSKGGCVMGRKDNLVKCNGYNPHFLGWGYEDDEAPLRVSKLGFNVGRVFGKGKVCWHLHHFDGTGSEKEKQPFYKDNFDIMCLVSNSSSYKIKDYINTWTM
jgi:GT2 family glycosyltransferase